MEYTNEMTLEIVSRSCNESLARVTVAAFATQLNPTLEEVADIKTRRIRGDYKLHYSCL